MKIARSQTLLSRIWSEPFLYDIGIACSALATAVWPEAKWWFAGITCFLAIVRTGIQMWAKAKDESPNDLEGCLHTLHASLMGGLKEEEADPCLRLTVHKVLEPGQEIEQLLHYVGDDRGGAKTAGRHFRATSGITGEAIKKKSFAVAKRKNDSYASYLKELVEDQGYSEVEAKRLNAATMAWFAVPLQENDEVVALVYCDATERDFFTEERQLLIQAACGGIARFIKKRYNS